MIHTRDSSYSFHNTEPDYSVNNAVIIHGFIQVNTSYSLCNTEPDFRVNNSVRTHYSFKSTVSILVFRL